MRRARDEDEQRGRTMAPGLIALVQQVEEQRPVLRVAAGVEEPPRLRIPGRGGPVRGLEERGQLDVAESFTGHGARRAPSQEHPVARVAGRPDAAASLNL